MRLNAFIVDFAHDDDDVDICMKNKKFKDYDFFLFLQGTRKTGVDYRLQVSVSVIHFFLMTKILCSNILLFWIVFHHVQIIINA
jgi:hypothetical protein